MLIESSQINYAVSAAEVVYDGWDDCCGEE
jgi:hypothetical protein